MRWFFYSQKNIIFLIKPEQRTDQALVLIVLRAHLLIACALKALRFTTAII